MAALTIVSLKKQKAFAWAKYYETMANDAENARIIVAMAGIAHNPPAQAELPAHITQEFYDMACKLRRTFECPCCLELVDKDNIKITSCGHIYDENCLNILKAQENPKCAMCRRKL